MFTHSKVARAAALLAVMLTALFTVVMVVSPQAKIAAQIAAKYQVSYLTPDSNLLPLSARSAVQDALNQWPNSPPEDNTFKVINTRFEGQWALLWVTPVKRAVSGEYLATGLEERFAIIAVNTAQGWRAELEWSSQAQTLLKQIPLSALAQDVRQSIFTGKVRTFNMSAPAIPVTSASSGSSVQSFSYNRNAANGWAGANNRNDNQFYGDSQGRYCTTYIGRAWVTGGVPGASTSWIGNGQIIQWMTSHTDLWEFRNRGDLVVGDIILFSSDSNYNDWSFLYSNGASRFGHSAFVNNTGRLSAWNAEYWDKPQNWYDNYGLPYNKGVHIKDGPSLPGTPTLSSPANGATLNSHTVTLSWQPGAQNSTGVSDWHVLVATDSNFPGGSIVYDNDSSWTHNTSINIPVSSDGTYYWKVNQGDQVSLSSGWTGTWSFKVITVTPVPPIGQQLLTNGGFEQDLLGWTFNTPNNNSPNNCSNSTNYSGAYEGAKFLAANRNNQPNNCAYIWQSVNVAPQLNDVYTATFFGRLGWSGIARPGRMLFWAVGSGLIVQTSFVLSSTNWQCFSVTMNVSNGFSHALSVNLFMDDTTPGPDYNFDAVTLERGTQNTCPTYTVGQNSPAMNGQSSAYWQDQFQQTYTRMNRPSIPVSDASNASQITQNGDALIANPGANRVFWAGWGLVNLLKVQGYPFNRQISQNESWGTLGFVGPPTGDETYLGGNAAYSVCFTNGCLYADNTIPNGEFRSWPAVDETYWRVDMFNDINAAGGYSVVHNWTMANDNFFLNGNPSPDPKILPTNWQMHIQKKIPFVAGTYRFQASALESGEWVTILIQYNSTGNWTTLLDTTGQPAGQMVYTTIALPAGTHHIFIVYGHATSVSNYGMTYYWQLLVPTLTPTLTPTNTPIPTISTPVPLRIDTIGIYRTGTFYMRNQNTTGFANITVAYNPATQPYPIVGDWTGSGIDTVGVYDQSNGQFMLRNSNTPGAPDETFGLGIAGDQPLSGRWQASATHSGVGVFRPSNGLIYLKNELSTGFADYTMVLGTPGDVGVAGDWQGQGYDSPGVFRPNIVTFYLSDQVVNGSVFGDHAVTLGIPGDVPIVGDWIGQGHDGVGVFRVSNGLIYMKDALTTGYADRDMVYGIANDIPVAGHWINSAAVSIPTAINLIVPNTPNAATATPSVARPTIRVTGQPNYDG